MICSIVANFSQKSRHYIDREIKNMLSSWNFVKHPKQSSKISNSGYYRYKLDK